MMNVSFSAGCRMQAPRFGERWSDDNEAYKVAAMEEKLKRHFPEKYAAMQMRREELARDIGHDEAYARYVDALRRAFKDLAGF